MTHNVHPYAHRLAILRGWKSRWFGRGEQYRKNLAADVLLREFLEKRLRTMHVSDIDMERSKNMLRILIKSSRPGLIIGRNGEEALKLKREVESFLTKRNLGTQEEVKIDIEEIRSPESNASIVAQMVRDGLERRLPFRRVIKQTMDKVIANRDVVGARIRVAGRLGGADMARSEEVKKGRIPLQTFRADVDYATARALLPYDELGVKVWIYKGDIFADDQK